MNTRLPILGFAFCAAAALPVLGWAQNEHGGGPHGMPPHSAYRGYGGGYGHANYVHHGYGPAYYGPHWNDGHWYHGWYGGTIGWWWTVDNDWYLYPAAVYPYPDPDVEPSWVIQAGAPGPATSQNWYYCPNPAGYYPSIGQCSTAWMEVPAVQQPSGPSGPPPPSGIPPPVQ